MKFWKFRKDGKPRPRYIGKRPNGQCWTNTLYTVERYPHLRFVTGYAFALGMWIPHAWCVTRSGTVIDTTWKKLGKAYYGYVTGPRTARKMIETGKAPWELFLEKPQHGKRT